MVLVELADPEPVLPLLVVEEDAVVEVEEAEDDPEALLEYLGELGRRHDSLLDVPVDEVVLHVEDHPHLEGSVLGGAFPAQPPGGQARGLVLLAVLDHAVPAVVADELLVVLALVEARVVAEGGHPHLDVVLDRPQH